MELGVVPDARTPGVSLTEGPQMGFLDKAKAAATELAAKADEALSSSGMAGPAAAAKQADRLFRDLGVLAYLESTGRPVDSAARERILAELGGIESQGGIPSFALQSNPPPPPGMAGQAGYAPPPPPGMAGQGGQGGYAAPPPPPGMAGQGGQGGFAAPPPPPSTPQPPAAPPPPPPWATGGQA